MRIRNLAIYLPLCLSILLAISGCSTGIERTKTIKMSGADKRATLPTPEEEFIGVLRPSPLAEWRKGKQFLVADNKVVLLFDPSLSNIHIGDSIAGEKLTFTGTTVKKAPDGGEICVILFRTASGRQAAYTTGSNPKAAACNLNNIDIPLLTDLDLVAQADSLLRGRDIWTRTGLWYDSNDEATTGRKFAKVRVDSVVAGDAVFPFSVRFTDMQGKSARIPMNIDNARSNVRESRVFQNLFSLADPRERYQNITDENWDSICRGQVRGGMTKEECRLALGNPADVDAGHDWNQTIDMWRYPDGRCLIFEDGLLTRIIH